MVLHVCKRCGYETTAVNSLRNHLLRKTPCIVTNIDISIDKLISELTIRVPIVKENIYKCDKCDQIFNHLSNKYRHQKICTVVPETLLEQKINMMENKIAELEAALVNNGTISNVSNSNVSNSNVSNSNVINGNNNIILNIYHNGDPNKYDTSTIDFDKLFSKIVDDPTNGIIPFLKMKYFNPDYPENHIIRINDEEIYKKTVYVHTDDDWKLESSAKVYNDLNNEAANGLLDNMNSGLSIARRHIPSDNFGSIYNELWGRDKKNPKSGVINGLNDLLVSN